MSPGDVEVGGTAEDDDDGTLALVAAHSLAGLVAAFVVGGLREIGEPARKALILDLVRPDVRARGGGLYYLLRSLAIAPAATVGASSGRCHPQCRSSWPARSAPLGSSSSP
jgi:hypothetical protein